MMTSRHRGMVATARAVCLLGSALPTLAAAQVQSWRPPEPNRCERVDFEADVGTCDAAGCQLSGGVLLRCEDLSLWADSLEVQLGDEGVFRGAVARGNVLMVDGRTVTRCQQLTLDEDQIRGRVIGASVRVKERDAKPDARGVPQGRDEAIFNGDIERTGPDTLRIENADYTLCDCGEDDPSWRLDASEIEAELGERATIWWPMLRINPFDLGLIPITPPLPPISVPLKSRAAGFLAPNIQLLGDGRPMIDVPVFVPLGDSFDVTLRPGVRTDWGTWDGAPNTWGAYRFGARVRYAPTADLDGEAEAQWTHDGRGIAALRFEESCAGQTTGRCRDAARQADERRALENRVTVSLEHRWRIVEEASWTLDAEWMSDDLIRPEFGVRLEDQVSNYAPSRSQLLVGRPGIAASLAADYLLETSLGTGDFSNVHGSEGLRGQRGPHVSVRMMPTHLLAGVHADADLGYVRYGPWDPDRPATQVLTGGRAGLSFMDRIGPLRLTGRGDVDFWRVEEVGRDPVLFWGTTFGATADTTLARRFGDWVHTTSPGLRYQVLPWLGGDAEDASGVRNVALDERLAVDTLHQVMGVWNNALYRQGEAGSTRVAELEIAQPFNLRNAAFLPLRVALGLHLGGVRAEANAGINWVKRVEPLEEVGGALSVPVRWFRFGASYSRWSPTAERFRRTAAELAADSGQSNTDNWVHRLDGIVGFRHPRVDLTYRIQTLLWLPIPGGKLPNEAFDRPYIQQHRVEAAYKSACQCWDARVSVSIPHNNPGEFRLVGTFNIGGFGLGSSGTAN